MSLVLKYKKAEYENRINTLKDYLARLTTRLENLENYKEQIKEYWEDENADKLYSSLSEMIRSVKSSIERTNTCISMCENTINTVDAGNAGVGEMLGNALKVLAGLE